MPRGGKLLGEDGPDTAPAFVYRTAAAAPRRPVVPFIALTDAIPVGAWPDHPLAAVFAAVFDGDAADRTVALGVRYAYPVAPGDPPVEARLPVLQLPARPYDSGTVGALTTAMEEWLAATGPPADGGSWALSLSLYPSVDRAQRRPLLQLERLSSALARAD